MKKEIAKGIRLKMRQIRGYKKGERFKVDKIIEPERAGKIIDYLLSN